MFTDSHSWPLHFHRLHLHVFHFREATSWSTYTGTSCTESDICFRMDITSSKQTWNALTTQWPVISTGLKGKWSNHLTKEHTVVLLKPCCSAAIGAPFRLCSFAFDCKDMLWKSQQKVINCPGSVYFLLYFKKTTGLDENSSNSSNHSFHTTAQMSIDWHLFVNQVTGVFKPIAETCLMVYSKLALLLLHSVPDNKILQIQTVKLS